MEPGCSSLLSEQTHRAAFWEKFLLHLLGEDAATPTVPRHPALAPTKGRVHPELWKEAAERLLSTLGSAGWHGSPEGSDLLL